MEFVQDAPSGLKRPETDEEKQARRKAAMDLVLTDKVEERKKKEERAAQRAAAKKAAERQAKLDAEAAAIAAAERKAAESEEARHALEERLAAEKAAEQVAAEAAHQAEMVAAAAEAERAAIAAREAAERAALEAERNKHTPAWVTRLNKPDFVQKAALAAESELHKMLNQRATAFMPAYAQVSAPSAIVYAKAASPTGVDGIAVNTRVQIAEWAVTSPHDGRIIAPRARAKAQLVLRQGAALDSKVVGRLPAGGQAFVLETQEIVPGTYRSLITATASTAAPLGWVTVRKVGLPLMALIASDCL
jgi:hypothetical protein